MAEAERVLRGAQRLDELNPGGAERLRATLADVAPDFPDLIMGFAFSDIHSRPGLEVKTRQLITVGALTALGVGPQLKSHLRNSLRVGCTKEELAEVMMQMSVYAGMPAAMNGLYALQEVLGQKADQ